MSEEDKEIDEQPKSSEASKETAKTAAKAGINLATSGAGSAVASPIVDALAQTELGDKVLDAGGQLLDSNALTKKAADVAHRSGALDAANTAMGAQSGGMGAAAGGQNLIPANKNVPPSTTPGASGSPGVGGGFPGAGGLSKPISDENKETDADADLSGDSALMGKEGTSFLKNHKFKIMILISSATVLLFVILSFLVVFGFAASAVENISNIWSGIVDFFTKDQQELEEEYYKSLVETQSSINTKYGICIDINLVTASLTLNKLADEMLEEGNVDEEDADIDDNGNSISYKKMKKQIKLLANMQFINKKYSLDQGWKDATGSYCSDTAESVAINNSNANYYIGEFASERFDSSTPELIASNDDNSFLKKRVNEEKNYAYYLYRPPFKDDNTCTDAYAESVLLEDKAELSIGDLDTMTESVFYWNLVNSFIGDYYDDYLPKIGPDRQKRIKEMAEEIYLLYATMEPSQTCSVPYAGSSTLCPNGVTVEGSGTFELEEYVAGVVTKEAYTSEGMEALKAQAVAARTYVLDSTTYCKTSIKNSTNFQTFTRDINDRAREAANGTAGEILTYDGNIFSSNYDSFCYEDIDCPDSIRNADGSFTVTYQKRPNGEKHIIHLTDPSQFWRITSGQGHANGMSQLLSYQLAKEGYTYDRILKYFYSNGVDIVKVEPVASDTGKDNIIQTPITNILINANTSPLEFSQYIYSQVSVAGVSTRNGVVSAATALTSGLYSKTGFILPYELLPSGKYTGYGIDPLWGTNTGNPTYPLNGLDCSGFISWAIHNGGYKYESKNAKGWGNVGNRRPWSKGVVDASANPGDLIYNPPSRPNGTSGHIRMIVGVNSSGYVVAEAGSKQSGVRVTTISFTSVGNYTLVDMSSYYGNTSRFVSDYPV